MSKTKSGNVGGRTPSITIGELITQTTTIALLDADVLLAEILGKTREYIYAHPEVVVSAVRVKKYQQWVHRRAQDEPLAYIVGHKEFYDLDFVVTPDVLVPRPDTELLIDTVLDWLLQDKYSAQESRKTKSAQTNTTNLANKTKLAKTNAPKTIVDIGTGSGNIAVTLAHHLPSARVIATDVSLTALRIAKKNAQRNTVKIDFYCGDVLDALPLQLAGKVDCLIFNAPYLTKTEARKKNLAHEPQVALTPAGKPTELIERLLQRAPEFLAPHGKIFLEIGHRQAKQVTALATKYLPIAKIKTYQDLGGYDRTVEIGI